MPDTTTATAYAPKTPKQRSFAGPIVLIVIGVLFLFGNLHVITWYKIATWFGNWWPLLLIVYGLLKLLEYYAAKRDGTQFRGVGAGGVLLVVFVIIFGLCVSGLARVNWNAMNQGWDGDFANLFGQEYSYTQSLEQDYPAGANLKVVSQQGGVNISAWDQNKIKVEVTKKVRAESQTDADRINQESQVSITVSGNDLTLSTNNDNKPVTSDLQIFVPKKGVVSIDASHGDVVVQSREGNVKITNSHGDVSIQDVTGTADISMRHGSFHATKVTGDVNLDGRLDDVSAAEVGGNLRMTGEYFGDLNVSKIAKSVTFTTSRTSLQFAKLDGDMSMESDALRASAINGPVKITTRSKDIHLENVNGNVELDNSNATVELSAADRFGQIRINNRNGSVDLSLPAKASFQVEARTQQGEIKSDYGLTTNSQHGNSVVSGQVGSGGPKIQINSQHGDVTIRKTI